MKRVAHNLIDMTGQVFGRLTVMHRLGTGPSGRVMWHCQCSCGVQKAIGGVYLRRGHTVSCGCHRYTPRPSDIGGKRFGRLIALRYVAKAQWLTRCDCGVEKVVTTARLNSGKTKSCGCYRRETSSLKNVTHGLTAGGSSPPLFHCWKRMVSRCTAPSDDSYHNYGGRGISVCAEWLADYYAFERDMGPRPSLDYSVDRIDVNGNYEPGNCRWATPKQQCNNMRKNVWIEFRGERRTVSQWAEHIGIHRVGLVHRLKKWTLERALTTPNLYPSRRGAA